MQSLIQSNRPFPGVQAGYFSCIIISVVFIFLSLGNRHWYMIPITLCALVLVPDAIKWLTGRYDLFDPLGIIAVIGILFFFINPILHVYFDTWMLNVPQPIDWRPWLGYMGLINFLGLIIYKWITGHQSGNYIHFKSCWKINYRRAPSIFSFALVVTFFVQIYVFARLGGIMGYVDAYTSGADAFSGMGWIFMISESFPMLLVMFYAIRSKHNSNFRSWTAITFIFLIFLLFAMLFGGLRGSRSNVVWQCFWFAGIVHYWIRPLKRKVVFVSLIGLFGFLFVYGQYKTYGTEALTYLREPELFSEKVLQSGRTPASTLLHDIGRSDVQAYVLYLLTGDNNYQYRFGSTYVHAIALLLPPPIRPQLNNKGVAAFELIKGMKSMGARTTYVYGLAGEAMLNFGPIAIPFAFAVFAYVVSVWRNIIRTSKTDDVRTLLFPYIIIFLFGMLTGDADQLVFYLIKFGLVPFIVLKLSSHSAKINNIILSPVHRK